MNEIIKHDTRYIIDSNAS